MSATSQKNFRMSDNGQEVLKSVAKLRNMNETEVVEYAVARFAQQLNVDVVLAREVLLRVVSKAVSSARATAAFEKLLSKHEAKPGRPRGKASSTRAA